MYLGYKNYNNFVSVEAVSSDPCTPNPCGPNTVCRAAGSVAHCSCLPAATREPGCRPECRTDSECPPQLACRNNKCRDPCPGACGAHAICRVRLHSAICTCPVNFVGDPFVRCLPGNSQYSSILEIPPTYLSFVLIEFIIYMFIFNSCSRYRAKNPIVPELRSKCRLRG